MARTGRPVIYRHVRVGKGGRRFECLKFRTMVPDAERVLRRLSRGASRGRARVARDHKLKNDPRITRVGAWLRRTRLDELPQLINVLRGEMSLVGPRPVVAEELVRYGDNIVYYVESTPGLGAGLGLGGRAGAARLFDGFLDPSALGGLELFAQPIGASSCAASFSARRAASSPLCRTSNWSRSPRSLRSASEADAAPDARSFAESFSSCATCSRQPQRLGLRREICSSCEACAVASRRLAASSLTLPPSSNSFCSISVFLASSVDFACCGLAQLLLRLGELLALLLVRGLELLELLFLGEV